MNFCNGDAGEAQRRPPYKVKKVPYMGYKGHLFFDFSVA